MSIGEVDCRSVGYNISFRISKRKHYDIPIKSCDSCGCNHNCPLDMIHDQGVCQYYGYKRHDFPIKHLIQRLAEYGQTLEDIKQIV